jgi:hypothetical protein
MQISQIGIRRIAEAAAEKDASYRQQFEQMNRPLRPQVHSLSDEELLAKLRWLGIDLDRERIEECSRSYAAAHEVASLFTCREGFDVSNGGEDWAWFAIELLWTRWLPERPHLELLDDLMQAGYAAQDRRDRAATCRHWNEAWSAVLNIMQRCGIETISAFDERFGGTQFVFNWVQDFGSELYYAGLDDKQFFGERVRLCQTVLERFREDSLTVENFRRALAESYILLGETAVGDELFRQWLDQDPRWGWGWIGWADCYSVRNVQEPDAERALQILRQGQAVLGLRNRSHLLARIERLLTAAGRNDEAADVRSELDRMSLDTDDPCQVQDDPRNLQHRGAATRLTRTLSFGEPSV